MRLLRDKMILIALAFAVYSSAILALFNPFGLISNESSILLIVYASVLIAIFFFAINTFTKLMDSILLKKGVFISSFIIAPIAAGLLLYYVVASDAMDYLMVYLSSFFVLSLLPSSIALLYSIFDEMQGKISVTSEPDEIENEEAKLKLQNDKGKTLLNVRLTNVICFEANDNYVITYHLDSEGNVEKSMERISLKKIDELVTGLGANFQRIHKSYIVNPIYVIKVLGKAQNHQLKLENIDKVVPVSRNFDVSFFEEK